MVYSITIVRVYYGTILAIPLGNPSQVNVPHYSPLGLLFYFCLYAVISKNEISNFNKQTQL